MHCGPRTVLRIADVLRALTADNCYLHQRLRILRLLRAGWSAVRSRPAVRSRSAVSRSVSSPRASQSSVSPRNIADPLAIPSLPVDLTFGHS